MIAGPLLQGDAVGQGRRLPQILPLAGHGSHLMVEGSFLMLQVDYSTVLRSPQNAMWAVSGGKQAGGCRPLDAHVRQGGRAGRDGDLSLAA